MSAFKLPAEAHTSRPWRIHELTRDFRLEDVWALPTPGGPDDFPRLVRLWASRDPSRNGSAAARALLAIRWRLGGRLGWDDRGSPLPSLRGRLPADLRDAPSGPEVRGLPANPLYLLDDEWALEIVNRTVHAVAHIGWVPASCAGYRGQLAVSAKPNGRLGAGYMPAIAPFRRLIVYPSLMREIGRAWRAGEGAERPPGREL
jgi:hypothetical protein